jgi:hypothetical protein
LVKRVLTALRDRKEILVLRDHRVHREIKVVKDRRVLQD